MRFPPSAVCFATSAAILALSAPVEAQTGGGSSRGGASGFGSGGAGGFGQSSFGSSGFGQSSFGSSGFGSGGQGSSSFGSSFGQTGSTFGGGAGNEPAFIGRNAADVLNAFGQAFGQSGSGRSGRSRSDRGDANPSSQRRPPIAVPLSIDPSLARAAAQLDPGSVKAMENAMRLMSREGLGGVKVSGAGGGVRLDGTVSTESQRLLAEKLLAIEPGVREIENLLEVLPQAAEVLPAPR